MSEVSKSKISDPKPQKMIILWTLKHVSAISEHPVFKIFWVQMNIEHLFTFNLLTLGLINESKYYSTHACYEQLT